MTASRTASRTAICTATRSTTIPAPDTSQIGETVDAGADEQSTGMIFTGNGARQGMRASLTIALGPLVWGISMGVIAADAGFSDIGSVLMSLLVYSGTAQVVAMEMVARDVGFIAILVATALVSLRYIPMGMTMRGWFRRVPGWLAWPGMQFLSDQGWAMTIQQFRDGRRDIGYFFGLNAGMVVTWVMGTALGATLGGWLGGHVTGLHFASTAALVGVLAQIECRRRDILPWVMTAIAAIAAYRLLDGAWYVLIGIGAGLIVFLVRGDNDARS